MVAITGDDVENSNITQLTDTTDTTERGQPAIATDELESPSTAAGPCADVESGNADDVDCTDTDAHAPRAPRRWRSRWSRMRVKRVRVGFNQAILAVILASLSVSAVLGWHLFAAHHANVAAELAQQTAIGYAQTLTSIDSNNVDANFNQVLDGATGEFKDMYTRSSVQLRQLLIDNKATAHGVVVDSAIQSKSKSRVVVLLMIDQTVTNAARPDPRVDRSRMKITMEKTGGRWLASKVELS